MVDVMGQVLLMPTGDVPAVYFDGYSTAVTISNNFLTVAHNPVTAVAGARTRSLQTTGKYYFEVLVPAVMISSDGFGVVSELGNFEDMSVNASTANGGYLFFTTGNLFSNNASAGASLGVGVANDRYSCAVDLDNNTIWFRRNGGNWNNSGTANPATNTGGLSISLRSTSRMTPAVSFASSAAARNVTFNFGSTQFTYTKPSGFVTWPAWDGIYEWRTAWQGGGAGASLNWNGFTLRSYMTGSVFYAGGSQVRVTLKGHTVEGSAGDSLYVGHAAATGDVYDAEFLDQVLFSGAAAFDTGVGGTIISDAKATVLDGRRGYLVTSHFVNVSKDNLVSSPQSGATAYSRSGSEANFLDANSVYTNTANVVMLAVKIEVYTSPPPKIRLDQQYLEVVDSGVGSVARLDQQYIDVIDSGAPAVRLAQQYIEVITNN